jgi:hypothetical protein
LRQGRNHGGHCHDQYHAQLLHGNLAYPNSDRRGRASLTLRPSVSEGVNESAGRRNRLPHPPSSGLVAMWGRQCCLPSAVFDRFFHAFSVSGGPAWDKLQLVSRCSGEWARQAKAYPTD